MKRSLFIFLFICNSFQQKCDLEKYQEFLANDGKDIFVVSSLCESAVELLKTRLAGKHGPVLQADMEAILCTDECIENDLIHIDAMAITGCNCAQLSSSGHIELDFCLQNSARFLCHKLGVCGSWNCKLEDYMCPRHEWNRKYSCTSNQLRILPTVWTLLFVMILTVMMN